MTLVTTALLLTSHILASWGFFAAFAKKELPKSVDFATASFLVFYDAGLLLEAFGYKYENVYFRSLMQADTHTFNLAFALLFFAPWMLKVGANVVPARHNSTPGALGSMSDNGHKWFIAFSVSVSGWLAFSSFRSLSGGGELWTTRAELGAALGTLVVLLYVPTHFAAFYARQSRSRTSLGTILLFGLAVLSAIAMLPLGQRTTVLLPVLVVVLFRFRLSLAQLIGFACVFVLLVSMMLTSFKWYYGNDSAGMAELLTYTLSSDLARSGVLAESVTMAEPWDTSVLPYPGAGYMYSALFFIPRQFAPFKGESTASHFTSAVADVSNPDWGLGLGMVEELMLNFGWALALPLVLFYGMGFKILDNMSGRMPALMVPSRLSGLWLCGYHLPALLLLFGSMALSIFALSVIFRPARILADDRSSASNASYGSLSRLSRPDRKAAT